MASCKYTSVGAGVDGAKLEGEAAITELGWGIYGRLFETALSGHGQGRGSLGLGTTVRSGDWGLLRARRLSHENFVNLCHQDLLLVLFLKHLEFEVVLAPQLLNVVRVNRVLPMPVSQELIRVCRWINPVELALGTDLLNRWTRDIQGRG